MPPLSLREAAILVDTPINMNKIKKLRKKFVLNIFATERTLMGSSLMDPLEEQTYILTLVSERVPQRPMLRNPPVRRITVSWTRPMVRMDPNCKP